MQNRRGSGSIPAATGNASMSRAHVDTRYLTRFQRRHS